MNLFFQKFKTFFTPLNGAQRALFVVFASGLILIVSLMFYWILKPNYTLLFGSLEPEAANEIVEELQTKGIGYKLGDNGRAISVPRDQVYDLRLQFASLGATGSDYRGYELFDQNSLGMTDFMQRLNQKRALEGELARTINSLSQVESSRIHIVLPERSPFQDTSVNPSASVIVNLKRGNTLDKDQISGIGALIAGSVENLSVEDVVILDQMGNRISENVLVDNDESAGSAQIKVRRDMEAYLTEKAQSMLDRVLGPGNSIIRVSTEHNFDRVVRESDLIDPESRVLISEERRTSRNAGLTNEAIQGQDQIEPFLTNSSEDETSVQVRNYEVNKVHEQHENVVGAISGISASLLLNHKLEPGEEEQQPDEFIPYSEDEIEEIRTIVSSAIGIQTDRGDQVAVTQIRFQDPFADENHELWGPRSLPASEILRYLFLTIVLIAISWLGYRMSRNFSSEYGSLLDGRERASGQLPDMPEGIYLEGDAAGMEDDDLYGKKLSAEAKRRLRTATARNDEIGRFIDENTSEAAALVRSLINQQTT